MITVSINVYKSIKTLQKQLETIKTHLQMPYVVILNCNKFMYDELKKTPLDENIHINPEIIEKKRYHGTLTKGIVSNMKYAFEHFTFTYFIILSGRTLFYRDIALQQFDEYFSKNKWSSVKEMELERKGTIALNGWHWPVFKKTKLAQYYIERSYKLQSSPHEGLCFSKTVCKMLLEFLDKHIDIANDLFSQNDACVEEFSLQTIASNEYDKETMEYGFIYIGNGCDEECDYTEIHKYTRKIRFMD
jgi:hypothetical protein